jgi:hypothetical protein
VALAVEVLVELQTLWEQRVLQAQVAVAVVLDKFQIQAVQVAVALLLFDTIPILLLLE